MFAVFKKNTRMNLSLSPISIEKLVKRWQGIPPTLYEDFTEGMN